MQSLSRRGLSLFLVLMLIVSLFSGVGVNAYADYEDGSEFVDSDIVEDGFLNDEEPEETGDEEFVEAGELVDSYGGEMSALEDAEYVQVGEGTSTFSYGPFTRYYKSAFIKLPYLQSELGKAGQIKKIAFECAKAKESKFDIQIFIAQTEYTTLTESDQPAESAYIKVYDHTGVTVGAETGWEIFELDIPYEYDGESNLVVAVLQSNGPATTQTTLQYKSATSSSVKGRRHANVTEPVYTGGTVVGSRINTRFYMEYCAHENHTEPVTVPVTCTTDGYTSYVCNDCGSTVKYDVIPAPGHNWDWDNATQPDENGNYTAVCKNEGCTETKTRNIYVDTWDGTGTSEAFEGSGTEADPYIIASCANLVYLQEQVDGGNTYSGKYFRLEQNLKFTDGLKPIGTSSKSFAGNFDGNGQYITIPDNWDPGTSGGYIGLFGYMSGGSVSDLTVNGSINNKSASTGRAAGIVAYALGSISITGCVSNVDISSVSRYEHGGICGFAKNGVTISGCVNNGNISTTGVNTTSSSTYSCAGGIAGAAWSAKIEKCINNGNVNTGHYQVGGIAGYTSSGTLDNCANTGKVTSASTGTSSRAGGIAGYTSIAITSCFSSGEVSGEGNTGDIRGGSGGSEQYCHTGSYSAETAWMLNTSDGTSENNLMWSVGDDGEPVFADDKNGGIVRVTFKCGDGYVVYAKAGSTVAAPEGYEDTDFGDFKPGVTIVTGDITVVDATPFTLRFYQELGSDVEIASMQASFGSDFAPPADPSRDYYDFAGWVRADGTAIKEGEALDVTALYATWTPAQTDGVYQIADQSALLWFAKKSQTEAAVNGILLADIVVDGESWTTIGTAAKKYAGTFDGNGHSITMNSGTTAVFYSIDASGLVKGLTVEGSITCKSTAGGIALMNYGTIENCVNKADVTSTNVGNIGGIVGSNYGVIRSCGNEGSINGTYSSSACNSGGICGRSSTYTYNGSEVECNVVVENCYNWGSVTATANEANVGGIMGATLFSSVGSCKVVNSYSSGTLTAAGASEDSSTLGAIIANVSGGTEISGCRWADSALTAAGTGEATVTDCEAYASAAALITKLNSYANENGLTRWYADDNNGGLPCFRVREVTIYTVTFTGEVEKVVEVESGSCVTLPVCEEKGYYYVFTVNGEAWDGTEPITGSIIVNVEKRVSSYTLSYSAGEGEGSVPDGGSYEYKTEITVAFQPAPTKSGFDFTGWTGPNGEFYSETGTKTFVITADTVLTAKFEEKADTGSGTEDDPYKIATADDLMKYAQLISAGDDAYISAYYIQTEDIDLSGRAWTPIGSIGSSLLLDSVYFAGTYDGSGKTISNLVYDGDAKGSGMFAGLNSATVKNLTVTGSITTSGGYAAGLACYVYGTSVIDNCTVKMDVTANTGNAGGIVGQITDDAVIKNSGHQGNVSNTGSSNPAGGIAAKANSNAQIINSYHGVGTVKSSGSNAGGIIGDLASASVEIKNCYSAAAEVSTSGTSVGAGGIAGKVSVNSAIALDSNFYNADGAANAVGYQASYNYNTYTANVITTPNALAASLNMWVASNEGYETWAVTEGENGGYPVFGEAVNDVFYIFYDLNGAEGSAPVDSTGYKAGDKAVLKALEGVEYKYHRFLGWSTSKEAAEAEYDAGAEVAISGNTTFYAVWAETTAWGGSGTNRTIDDAAGFIELADKINSVNRYKVSGSGFEDYNFTLTTDVDLTGTEFEAIGYFTAFNNYNTFDGIFDGGGHTVTYALSGAVQGLFGYTGTNAVVRNVKVAGTIETANSTSSDIGKGSASGGVVGYNKGTVSGCTSSVVMSSESSTQLGGIVGRNNGTISGCFYTGTGITGSGDVGGIAGFSTGKIINCAVKSGSFTANGGTYQATVGGIAGSGSGTIHNSYAWTGSISGYYAGGIIGSSGGDIRNNYSAASAAITGTTVGGIIGNVSGGVINNNYWLAGTADDDAGYDNNDKAFRNSSFTADGTLTEAPNAINTPNKLESAGIPGTLLGCLKFYVTTAADDSLSGWKASTGYPVFEGEEVVTPDTVTVKYEGAFEGSEIVEKGGSVKLPECQEKGYKFSFTVNGEPWDGTNITEDVTVTVTKVDAYSGPKGSGTETDPYQLTSQKDLLFVDGKIVAADAAYVTAYYKVMNDFECDASFMGLGYFSMTAADARPFSGTIDGSGKTITVSVTKRTESSMPGAAFVNYAKGTYIHDLTIAGTVTNATGATGGFAGYYGDGTRLENCVNIAAIAGNGNMTGGIAGGYAMMQTGTAVISGCTNKGEISSTGGAGGVGGIVGSDGMSASYLVKTTVTKCVNEGSVTVTGSGSVGGIAGALVGTVSESCNTGAVSNAGNYTAGIAGQLKLEASVTDSYNTGAVTYTKSSPNAQYYVAGISASSVSASTVKNCYNVGSVTTQETASSGKQTLGGIDVNGTVENSYYLDSCVENSAAYGTAKTADEMKEAAFAATLGDKFAADKTGLNSGYPLLAWAAPSVPGSYKVIFTGDYEGEQTVAEGENAVLPENPESGVYSFTVNGEAWDGTNIRDNVTVKVTLTKYVYTVTFQGAVNYTQQVTYGENAVLPICEIEGKQYRFTVDGKAWDGIGIKANVKVLVALVTIPSADVDVWDGSSAEKWKNGSGSSTNPYLIETAAQLEYLRQQVSGGTGYTGLYFKVVKDLDMTAANWVGIGGDPSASGTANAFAGTFDGDGHTITISANGGSRLGLFTNSDSSTVIKNVVVEGTVSGSGYNGIGGIIGVNKGLVDGCVNRASIIANGSTESLAGGMAGESYFGSITNCGNEGSVESSGYAGGIAGEVYAYCGSGTMKVDNCYNWGSVNGVYVGGLVGCTHGGSGGKVSIANGYSSGTITGTNRYGILGYEEMPEGTFGTTSYTTVSKCYWLSGTASDAAPSGTSTSGCSSFTDSQYGALLTWLNSGRDSYNEWFADTANGSRPAFRQVLSGSHTITFVADGEIVETLVFNEGDSSVKAPATPAKEGYVAVWEDYELGTENITVNAVYRRLGDVNGDGHVNAIDAMLILRHCAKLEGAQLEGIALLAADVDVSGGLNSTDAVQILKYSVGMLEKLGA